MNRLFVITTAFLVGCSAGTSTSSSGGQPSTTAIAMETGTSVVTLHRESGTSVLRVAAPSDQVWTLLRQVYYELGIPTSTLDPSARVLGNGQVTSASRIAGEPAHRFLDCGTDGMGIPVASNYTINLSVLTSVRPGTQGDTQVENRVTGTAMRRGVSADVVQCASTGRLEKRISDLLTKKLGS
ncbi:MAG: hypothetical protein M3418_10400 [Gemmatimonadota bacterium]|jgi:hypothetical protein|nr:hypothetical protein [Gemmatimonadota bacterium]